MKNQTNKSRRSQKNILYYALIEQMEESIFLIDVETKAVIESNPASQKLLGYDKHEMQSLTVYDYVHHERENVDSHIECVLSKNEHFHGPRVYRGKNGRLIDVEVTAKLITYRGKQVLCVVARDFSERKRVEDALRESEKKLRILSSHLLTAQETERRRISRELHDELGQDLMVLKFQIDSISKRLRKDQNELKEKCESVLHFVNGIVEKVRRISRVLSPTILENLGLSGALQCLVKDFGHANSIRCQTNMPKLDNLFSRDQGIMIYRIFQEALTNIGKHSSATLLTVVIKIKEGYASFLIEDNGVGFDVASLYEKGATGTSTKPFGLRAMEERVRTLRGNHGLSSEKGKGTKISFRIPVNIRGVNGN